MKLRQIAALSVLAASSVCAVSMATRRQIPLAEIKHFPSIPRPNQTVLDMTQTAEEPTPSSTIDTSDVDLTDLPETVIELKKSLLSLHHISVHSFESSPMFGANRASFQIPSYSDFRLPAIHLPTIRHELRGWPEKHYIRVRDFNSKDIMNGYEAWSWLYAMRWITSRGFVYRESDLQLEDRLAKEEESNVHSKLIVGLPTESGRLDFDNGCLKFDPVSTLEPSDQLWELQRMELISILKHDPPVAYEKRPPNSFQDQPRIMTRILDDLEHASLQRLKSGENHVIVWDAERQLINMVAAIRAKDGCLGCHNGKLRGGLLGAFTYRFREPPKPEGRPDD